MADPTVPHIPGQPTGRHDELLARFTRWDKELTSHWGEWLKEARESFDFVAGRQWDADDESKMRDNGRQPVVFNRIGPMIDSVAGTEIQGRQQVQYLPRVSNPSQPLPAAMPGPFGQAPQPPPGGAAPGAQPQLGMASPMPPAPVPGGAPGQVMPQPGIAGPGAPGLAPGGASPIGHNGGPPLAPPPGPQVDTQSAVDEILTKGADWIRDQCDADQEESDAFRDTLICGIGWTETRMDYEEEPEGKILIERVDPLEVLADPKSRKPNFADARYLRRARPYSKEEFEERWPGAQPVSGGVDSSRPTIINDPRHRYEDGDVDGGDDENTVTVKVYQWFEREPVHLMPMGDRLELLSAREHEMLSDQLGERMPDTVKIVRRRYYRAFVCGAQVLEYGELPDGEFTWKAITGKRDRNKGVWYGLARPMKDPQRWSNKLISQALHILNTNAKGGLLAEADAFEDARQAEESWSKADSITWLRPGAAGKVQPKTAPPLPQAIPLLVEWSASAVRDATGINQEILGMTDRTQPGVVEQHRKESAFAILAPFFDGMRRYRRIQGRLLLKYIQKYLPNGTLVRIIGDDGLAKFVPMAKQPDTVKFDVIVDEAPAGPNEKRRVFELLTQFIPALRGAGPEIWSQLVLWSPLPATLAQKLSQMLASQSGPKPPTPEQQADMAESQAQAARDNAGAALDQARAQHVQMESAAIAQFGPVRGAPGM